MFIKYYDLLSKCYQLKFVLLSNLLFYIKWARATYARFWNARMGHILVDLGFHSVCTVRSYISVSFSLFSTKTILRKNIFEYLKIKIKPMQKAKTNSWNPFVYFYLIWVNTCKNVITFENE